MTFPVNNAPVVNAFFPIEASVSSAASASAPSGFRGLYIITSTTLNIVNENGNELPLDNIPKNTLLWIAGTHLSVISTATAQYGVI